MKYIMFEWHHFLGRRHLNKSRAQFDYHWHRAFYHGKCMEYWLAK